MHLNKIFIVLIGLLAVPFAYSEVILKDGFETGSFGSHWVSNTGMTINNTIVRSGTYSAQSNAKYIKATANMTTLNATCAVYIYERSPSTQSNYQGIDANPASGDFGVYVRDAVSTSNYSYPKYGAAIAANVPKRTDAWVRIALHSMPNGTYRFWADGVQLANEIAATAGFANIFLGAIGSGTSTDTFYDDFKCWNGSYLDEPDKEGIPNQFSLYSVNPTNDTYYFTTPTFRMTYLATNMNTVTLMLNETPSGTNTTPLNTSVSIVPNYTLTNFTEYSYYFSYSFYNETRNTSANTTYIYLANRVAPTTSTAAITQLGCLVASPGCAFYSIAGCNYVSKI
jgi:hypothetical protein